MKLRLKIPLFIIGFVLVTTVVVFAVMSVKQRDRTSRMLRQNAHTIGLSLARQAEKAMVVSKDLVAARDANKLTLAKAMHDFAKSEGVVYIAVLDSASKLQSLEFLASSEVVWDFKDKGQSAFDVAAIRKEMMDDWFGGASEIILYPRSFRAVNPDLSLAKARKLLFDDFIHSVFRKTPYRRVRLITDEFPLQAVYQTGRTTFENKVLGTIQIGLSRDYIDRFVLRDFMAVLPYILGVFGLIVLLAVIFSLDTVAAIKKLSDGTEALAKDLSVRIKMKRKDELGIWAGMFNGMAEKLKAAMDELRDKYEEVSKLFKLATEDGLTKAFVHRYLMDIFQNELSRSKRYKNQLSFLMTDIDHFKKFNDTWGHQAGDFVLEQVAHVLLENVRKNIDTVGRYGGEEFGIILPYTDRKGALLAAEKLRKLVETARFKWKGTDLEVKISIGVTTVMAASTTKEAMVKWADKALYQSKENGRNMSTFYSEDKDV